MVSSRPQIAAAVSVAQTDLVPASPEVQETNIVTVPQKNSAHASPQVEPPKENENNLPKKRRGLGKAWGFGQ
jgi:hypothetical protein